MVYTKLFLNIAFLVIFLFVTAVPAADRQSSFQFLNAVYSPRLAALGGGFSSLGGDISSTYFNPAGLAWNDRTEISFTYGDYLLDLRGGWLGFNYPISDQISCGGGIIYFDHGSFTGIDRFGSLTGNTFTARDVALSGSIAGTIQRFFAWGVTVKYAHSKIDKYSAGAAAVDLGVMYRLAYLDDLTAGIAVRNLGQSLNPYYEVKESLPTSLSFSLTKQISPYPVIVHAGWNNLWPDNDRVTNNLRNFSAGLEITALVPFNVRLGYNNQHMNDLDGSGFRGFSAGFGLQLGIHQFDYGYANYGDAGMTHHFGLTFRFGNKSERVISRENSFIIESSDAFSLQDVRFLVNLDTMIISWQPVEGALYNVYVRLEGSTEWALINRVPQEQNYLKLKAPRAKGIYIFRIVLVVDGKERYFSKEFKLQI